jgi:hypothetical protein
VATRSPKPSVQAVQRIGHLPRACRHVTPGVAVNVAFNPARDDFGVAMVALGKIDQGGNQQRLALHQTQHGYYSLKHIAKKIGPATDTGRFSFSRSAMANPVVWWTTPQC